MGARLGEDIVLEAYDAAVVPADGGGEAVRLTLYWRALRPVSKDYTVFAHLLSAGEKREQKDGPACAGACPTTVWTPGGVIADTRLIPLPPGLVPENLEVLVGLYEPQSGRRLPVTDRQGRRLSDDGVRLVVPRRVTR